jgi:RsiW-degrading membrane proteinase PrsW (M82 family)
MGMISASNQPYLTAGRVPPYPAALTVLGHGWRSEFAHDGRIVLARPVIQLGRMQGNEVVLDDPLVSRHHAVIRWITGGYEIEDLGSSNGTYVGGQRIQGRVVLAPAQTIRIGNTELRFDVLGAALDAAPPDAATQSPDGAPALSASVPATEVVPGAGFAPLRIAPLVAPAGAGPAPLHPYEALLAGPQEHSFVRLVRTEWGKRYWRVFVLGLVAYAAVMQVLSQTDNLHLVPLAMLVASMLVPVVFVIFCWEQSAFADMPAAVVGATFMSGAVLGLTIAAVVEPALLPAASSGGISLAAALLVGLTEETAKVVSVIWFLRDRRLRSELDGLILGAAAGMGFAALETAGYGFTAFLTGFGHAAGSPGASLDQLIHAGITQMNYALIFRMALAIFGHGVWTAIVCATIWRERRQSTFRLTPSVLLAFGIAVLLHALWDWSPLADLLPATAGPGTVVLAVIGWFLFVGVVGLFFLRFFLRESLQRAKLGPQAPAPPPLLSAILRDTFGWLLRPAPTAAPQLQMAGAPLPAGMPVWQAPGDPRASAPAPVPPPWPHDPPKTARSGPQPAYCPRCSLYYPPGSQRCGRCQGPLAAPH